MIAGLLLAEVVTLGGASETVEPATSWRCSYVTSGGDAFNLSGSFPEFPKGSPANKPMPSMIGGTGPAFLLGEKPVNSFKPENGKRIYQVSFSDRNGDRFNLNFKFAEKSESRADITHWLAKEQRLVTYAKGTCVSDFHPERQVAQ